VTDNTADARAADASAAAPGASGAGGMTWTLPPHWRAQSETSSMRLATIAVVAGSDNAEVTVTRFPGDVGGLLPNINRWRRQLSLPAVQSLREQPLAPLRVAGEAASFLELAAQDGGANAQRMYVVILPHDEMTWFLKMTGTSAFLESQRASFDAFVDSVAFTGGTPGE
jgi:hypothetical protein